MDKQFLKNGKKLITNYNIKYYDKITKQLKDFYIEYNDAIVEHLCYSNINYSILIPYYEDKKIILTESYENTMIMIHSQYKTSIIKQELMEKFWHPSRYNYWKYIM
jgi:hypothetical protein